MYKVNLSLRTIIYFIFSILVIFMDNYYLFWLLVFYTLLLSIVDRYYKSLLCDFAIVLILLFCYYTSKIKLIIKVLFLINFFVIYISSFSKIEMSNIKYRALYSDSVKSRKKLFFENNIDRIVNKNRVNFESIYKKDISLKEKNNFDLNKLYVFSRTRFYGYSNKITNFSNTWKLYDTLFLIVSILVLLLIYLYW